MSVWFLWVCTRDTRSIFFLLFHPSELRKKTINEMKLCASKDMYITLLGALARYRSECTWVHYSTRQKVLRSSVSSLVRT